MTKCTTNPIYYGPFFDFSDPSVAQPETTASPVPTQPPALPLTNDDYPNYATVLEIVFYTIEPTQADLKTRNCSEAYHRYYLEMRFNPMKDRVVNDRLEFCHPDVDITMTDQKYYSEYTDGTIQVALTFTGKGQATLNDINNCYSFVSDYVAELGNWEPGVDYTTFLRNDYAYTKGCSRLHMKPESFVTKYYGWTCPSSDGKLGSSEGNMLTASLITVAFILFAQIFLQHLQR